ncbi:MAG: MBL fold metallo-hydrolase [Acidobacteria bacterium]|nr:MAG: MBL fold metallo-hydrolase [Acidobacteriota bacterium]REK07676.1 MAG: MBL fold metallo-hydrolase [Acidobacteriota bacterium]
MLVGNEAARRRRGARLLTWTTALLLSAGPGGARTTEFCLEGLFDIGVRHQGLRAGVSERTPTTWCVVTEDDGDRVVYRASGKVNPDLDDSWAVAYPAADVVRIVNRDDPPDVEFRGVEVAAAEARRVRRLDPRRLAEELESRGGVIPDLDIELDAGRIAWVTSRASFPLRGEVPVVWRWRWDDPAAPRASLTVESEVVFEASGRWRELAAEEATALWQLSGGVAPIEAPAEQWPARVAMRRIDLDAHTFLVRGVRTGFQHLVVDTEQGLVVADAPAGWVELHHLPPRDLVGGLGVSGLSEGLIDFLEAEAPGRPLRAVALTHFHDDHAGGARAFAAAGAEVLAPADAADFLDRSLDRAPAPPDRLARSGGEVSVRAVAEPLTIGERRPVTVLPMDASPHVGDQLGVWARDADIFFVSDVHVPVDEEPRPRTGRERTECWFAGWATGHLGPNTRVANSHSAVTTPVSRLREIAASPTCRGLTAAR